MQQVYELYLRQALMTFYCSIKHMANEVLSSKLSYLVERR